MYKNRIDSQKVINFAHAFQLAYEMETRLNDNLLPLDQLMQHETPFYFYDLDLLRATISHINELTASHNAIVHYAVKANGNPRILKEIAAAGLGADVVSGGEILAALDAGFSPGKITFAGVGKTDWEIKLGLEHEIGCFNVESVPELEVISQLATEMGKTANVALRVNPDIDAHTHRFITTATADNKFGIAIEFLPQVVKHAHELPGINLCGLHFHLGSQITVMRPYQMLCETINRLLDDFEHDGTTFEIINVGGGLGIDYADPDTHPIADFGQFFATFHHHLNLRQGQQLHFELGRSIVGQCGSLIARATYVKHNRNKQFVILDAGMTDLIRPALYDAHHKIENLSSRSSERATYDVVGPVCESSDTFAHDCSLPTTQRGDLIAIRSAGAYGESMASTYNMRRLPQAVFSV